MTHELELAAADAGADRRWWRRAPPHTRPLGSPCANCDTALQGAWCHVCGQLGEDFHRSSLHLVGEAVEGLFHFDGRLWSTLPDLALRPAQLTRRYLDGHRAPQIPPLRLFLVALLIVFLAGSITGKLGVVTVNTGSVADRSQARAALGQVHVEMAGRRRLASEAWLRGRAARVLDDPEKFKMVIEEWSERFAFLMLPLSALLLSLLFVFQRQFYVFDHLIFSMHSLAFMGVLVALALVGARLTGAALWLLGLAPIHLFLHLRGVYRTSVVGTLVRMILLGLGSLAGFIAITLGLVWVGLNAMGGA